jgi:hypothetical protein
VKNVAFLAPVLSRLIDTLAEDVEDTLRRVEVHLERRTVGLFEHAVIDEPPAGQRQLQTVDLNRLSALSPEISWTDRVAAKSCVSSRGKLLMV